MKTPQQILDEQEPRLLLMDMARDRFACGCWPSEYDSFMPSTPEDFLAWIEDEIQIQLSQLSRTQGDEQELLADYITGMTEVAAALRTCGVVPATGRLPWNVYGES